MDDIRSRIEPGDLGTVATPTGACPDCGCNVYGEPCPCGVSDEQAFHLALDANPSDSGLRLVFADWLEERGDERADGYRALGELGKWPSLGAEWWWTNEGCRGWCTFTTDDVLLPASWFDLTTPSTESMSVHAGFPTRQAAEDAAALAFARLTPDQQAAARGFPGSPDTADTTPPRR